MHGLHLAALHRRGTKIVELFLGRKIRLTSTTISTCASFIKPVNSTRTNLLNANEIVRPDEDNAKSEPSVEETISQSESQDQNTVLGPQHHKEAFIN